MKIITPSIFLVSTFGLLISAHLNAQEAAQTSKPIVYPPMMVAAQAPVYTLGDVFYSRAGHAERNFKNGGATFKEVIDTYNLSAQYGKNQAYFSLGNFYANNNDGVNALENYKKSSELKIFGASYQAAALIHKRNPNDCADALPFLEKAMAERSSSSYSTAAKWYIEKTCGANDDKKALELALNVTNFYSYTHINYIARAYLDGIGTQKNLPLAWAYLTIASNMAKSDTSWVKHDPQYAIDTLAKLDTELKRQSSEYTKAQNELDELCKASYLCPMQLRDRLRAEGRTSVARALPFPPPAPPPPIPFRRAPAPEGYKKFEDLSATDFNKYKELRELYRVAIDFEREYLKTNPRPIDNNLLIEKYLVSAEAGHANAMYRLSGLYQHLHNNEKTLEWLKKAADAGNHTAQLKYGQLSLNPLNCADAIKYLGFAEYDLSVPASIALGELYGSNRCGPPDYGKAFKANVRAAKFGNLPAQIALADAFYSAKGTAQHLPMAVAWGKISWYNSPSRGIFAPSNQRQIFERAKTIEKTLIQSDQVEVKKIINETCLFETSCRNISNEDLIKMQVQEN